MDSHSVTAVTPFRFLDLPREVRDDIYEATIFDLNPPDMFLKSGDPDSVRLRRMNTDVLLTNRKVYWETRDLIVRRAQLIMVSIARQKLRRFEPLLNTLSGITGINPMYRNLCVMSHHIEAYTSSPEHEADANLETEGDWEFILHRKDAQFFCAVLMGEFDFHIDRRLGSKATHTLNLHCSSTYGQNEFNSVYATQKLVLEKYRNTLRNFEHFSIRGASIGWESGLYGAVLQDIRSIDDKRPTELIDHIRTLELEGSQILLETGDLEAADVFWVKALGVCDVATCTFRLSRVRFPKEWYDKTLRSRIARWDQLIHQSGNACAAPVMELCYKLTNHRLSGALRFIQQGHHLAIRRGRAPRPKCDYVDFVDTCCRFMYDVMDRLMSVDWSPQPSEEARLCSTKAAIFRLLDATDEVARAYRAVKLATELVPDDECIQHERERVETWIRRLVDDGTLESFPES